MATAVVPASAVETADPALAVVERTVVGTAHGFVVAVAAVVVKMDPNYRKMDHRYEKDSHRSHPRRSLSSSWCCDIVVCFVYKTMIVSTRGV